MKKTFVVLVMIFTFSVGITFAAGTWQYIEQLKIGGGYGDATAGTIGGLDIDSGGNVASNGSINLNKDGTSSASIASDPAIASSVFVSGNTGSPPYKSTVSVAASDYASTSHSYVDEPTGPAPSDPCWARLAELRVDALKASFVLATKANVRSGFSFTEGPHIHGETTANSAGLTCKTTNGTVDLHSNADDGAWAGVKSPDATKIAFMSATNDRSVVFADAFALSANMPTSDPAIAGVVWCDVANGRVLKVSAGE